MVRLETYQLGSTGARPSSREPQTHRDGKPPWLQAAVRNGAKFVEGDMRDREVVESSLDGIDVVFQ